MLERPVFFFVFCLFFGFYFFQCILLNLFIRICWYRRINGASVEESLFVVERVCLLYFFLLFCLFLLDLVLFVLLVCYFNFRLYLPVSQVKPAVMLRKLACDGKRTGFYVFLLALRVLSLNLCFAMMLVSLFVLSPLPFAGITCSADVYVRDGLFH